MRIRIIHLINDATGAERLSIQGQENFDTPAKEFAAPGERVESDIFFYTHERPSMFPLGHDWARV